MIEPQLLTKTGVRKPLSQCGLAESRQLLAQLQTNLANLYTLPGYYKAKETCQAWIMQVETRIYMIESAIEAGVMKPEVSKSEQTANKKRRLTLRD